MAGTLDIKRRITSIGNTRKVTKAMEVVSAAKMKKAVAQVLALRPYATAMHALFANVAPHVRKEHPLLAVRDVSHVLVIVIASNKGLCGSFNAALHRLVRSMLARPDVLARSRRKRDTEHMSVEKITIDFVTIGKKADHIAKTLGKDPIATFPEMVNTSNSQSVAPLVKLIFDTFSDGTYDKVAIVYTDYVNAISQEQKIRQLLPVSHRDLAKQLAEMEVLSVEEMENNEEKEPEEHSEHTTHDYLIEPSNEEVLEALVPRVIESQILHALYESNASEESSRMLAMKNATDAAGDIVDDLTLTYNKIRQAKITQEISEISAGRAALE